MTNALPIVALMFDAEHGEFDEELGTERLYYADLRLREYRSVDGSAPWIIKESEIDADMETIIENYRKEVL